MIYTASSQTLQLLTFLSYGKNSKLCFHVMEMKWLRYIVTLNPFPKGTGFQNYDITVIWFSAPAWSGERLDHFGLVPSPHLP